MAQRYCNMIIQEIYIRFAVVQASRLLLGIQGLGLRVESLGTKAEFRV